jgi:hypothetical protein
MTLVSAAGDCRFGGWCVAGGVFVREAVEAGGEGAFDYGRWTAEGDEDAAGGNAIDGEALGLEPVRYRCEIGGRDAVLGGVFLRGEPLVIAG